MSDRPGTTKSRPVGAAPVNDGRTQEAGRAWPGQLDFTGGRWILPAFRQPVHTFMRTVRPST